MPLVLVGRIGRPHGVQGELALDGCPLTPLELHDIGEFTWQGRGGRTRSLEPQTHEIHSRQPRRAERLPREDHLVADRDAVLVDAVFEPPEPVRLRPEDRGSLGDLGDLQVLAKLRHPRELIVDQRLERSYVKHTHRPRRLIRDLGQDRQKRRLGFA